MLTSTKGLDELVALEVLDLRSNLIASLQEVRRLAGGAAAILFSGLCLSYS